ncbi:MAG: hypothetical protein EXR63_02380 [Dehalococcoidia bacterium]|nr:hypothetical protein [Dehalococcoidia bacterium]
MPLFTPSHGLHVEFDAGEPCPLGFAGDPTVLLSFMSWAYSVRLGGTHELARAALHLQRRHKVDMRPLTTYADRDVEDDDDRHQLDHAWQDALPLAAACTAAAAALRSDDAELRELVEGYDTLGDRLDELAAMSVWAAEHGARVRLTFRLD